MTSVIGSQGILHFAFAFSRFFSQQIFQSPNTWQACGDWVTMANSFPLTSLIFLHDSGLPLGKDKIHCKSSVALLIIYHCRYNSNKLALNSWFPHVLSQFSLDRAAEQRQKSGRLLDDIWQIEGTFREGDFECWRHSANWLRAVSTTSVPAGRSFVRRIILISRSRLSNHCLGNVCYSSKYTHQRKLKIFQWLKHS